jgi:hypothetical protein
VFINTRTKVESLERALDELRQDYDELSVVKGPYANSRTLHRLQIENRRLKSDLENVLSSSARSLFLNARNTSLQILSAFRCLETLLNERY